MIKQANRSCITACATVLFAGPALGPIWTSACVEPVQKSCGLLHADLDRACIKDNLATPCGDVLDDENTYTTVQSGATSGKTAWINSGQVSSFVYKYGCDDGDCVSDVPFGAPPGSKTQVHCVNRIPDPNAPDCGRTLEMKLEDIPSSSPTLLP